MKSSLQLIMALSFAFLATSCKKSSPDNSNNNDPVIPPDTLSTGWTKHVINGLTSLSGGGDISFLNRQTGYVTTQYYGLYKTTDGGLNWTFVSDLRGTNMATTADNKVFTVNNSNSRIFRSEDGGQTFTNSSPTLNTTNDVFFVDNNTGYCTTNMDVLKTSDGGINWSVIATPPQLNSTSPNFIPVYSTSSFTCIGYSNKVYYSRDNDVTWTFDSIPSLPSDVNISAISAPSTTVIYLVTVSGYFCKSVNAAGSFSVVKKFDNTSFRSTGDIDFIDNNTGFLSQDNRIYKTTDGGNTWTMVVALGNSSINEIDFVDATHGWALCQDGSVLRYAN